MELEVGARLSPTQWLGVGFSDRGQLEGADLCVLWVDWRRHVRVQVGETALRHICLFCHWLIADVSARHKGTLASSVI